MPSSPFYCFTSKPADIPQPISPPTSSHSTMAHWEVFHYHVTSLLDNASTFRQKIWERVLSLCLLIHMIAVIMQKLLSRDFCIASQSGKGGSSSSRYTIIQVCTASPLVVMLRISMWQDTLYCIQRVHNWIFQKIKTYFNRSENE